MSTSLIEMRINYFLFFILSLVFITGCAPTTKEISTKIEKEDIRPVIIEKKTLFDEISEKWEKKLFKEIIEIYEKRKNEFEDLNVLKPVLISFLYYKRFDDIVKIGEEKLAKIGNLNDNDIRLILAIAYYQQGAFEASRRILNSLYDGGFKNELVNIYLVFIYQKKNQFALALSMAGEIENFEKRNYIQGWLLFKQGYYEKALEKFLSLKNYKNSDIYVLYCFFYLNKYDEMLKYLEENKIDLNYKTIPIISLVLVSKGEVKKAKELLESIPESEKKAEYFRNLGLIYDIYFDDMDKAKAYYKKYLKEVKDEEVRSWVDN